MDQFKEDLKTKQSNLDLNLLRMIESRITEIIQIENEIKKKYPKLFQQRLPRFMRRRAASHNPKRIPKRLRPTKFNAKERRKLYKYRLRIRYQKHKRILNKHARHKFKDSNKTVLHKWFAKRFKMSQEQPLEHVPLHNNTKNQRNLYRQTRYGCVYLSFAHLVAIKIDLEYNTATVERLNKLANSISGFTFSAISLESGRYEIAIHLFKSSADGQTAKGKRLHLCPALVNNHKTHLLLWIPRLMVQQVQEQLEKIDVPFSLIMARDCVRIRLLGPESRSEAMKIAEDKNKHQDAIQDVDRRLLPSQEFGASIGRFIRESNADFIYYQTKPVAVDVVFRNKAGRMLWHQLVKNKAHLVGGKRDVDNLLTANCFKLEPDCNIASARIVK